MNLSSRAGAVQALEEFGCAPGICAVVRELPEQASVVTRGTARAYRLLLPSEGSPSGMHAHADRLYLLLDPIDAERLHTQHGAGLMRHNPTTSYISWTAKQLEDLELRAVVIEAAALALNRARDRSLTLPESAGQQRGRTSETCTACWTAITPAGNCFCD